jgi:hypothetical protein
MTRFFVANFFDSKPLSASYHAPYGSFMHLDGFDPVSVSRDTAAGILVGGGGEVIVRGDLIATVAWTVSPPTKV